MRPSPICESDTVALDISNTYTLLLSLRSLWWYHGCMSSGARLQRLEALDVSTLTAVEANAALRDLSAIRGRTDQIEASVVRRIAELHADGHAVPVADALGNHGKTSRRSAEKAERRAGALGHTPKLDDALGAGRVGSEHADAVANATAQLSDEHRDAVFARDDEITELATSNSPDTFRRKLTKLVDDVTDDDGAQRAEQQEAAASASMKVDDDTGMHVLFARLTPEQGNRVRRALDAEVAKMVKLPEFAGLRRDQLLARALDRLVCGDGAADGIGPAEVAVLIDYTTLVDGRHDDTVCEYSDGTSIPAEQARRHACDAGIIPVVLDGEGRPLDVGRAKRLATREQRVALRAMYRTCAIDGCVRHFDTCHIHHLAEWEAFGLTDLANLLPLCSFHHHRAHEGRWRLQLEASSRQLTVRLPDGTLHSKSLPDLLEQRRPAA